MNLLFITDARFIKGKGGKYYSGEASFSNTLWERYLKSFDEVQVIGRVFENPLFSIEGHIVNNVKILPVIPFESVFSFVIQIREIRRLIKSYIVDFEGAIIIRGAGSLGYLAVKICKELDIPFALELVGDPHEVYAPGVIKHPLRPFLRYLFTQYQKKAALSCSAILYVTKNTLQRRYPVKESVFSTYASDVFISEISFETKVLVPNKKIELISIGSLDQMYKAPDIALKAVKLFKEKYNNNIHLTWLGKGHFKNDMEIMAQELGLRHNVSFMGSVSSETVKKLLAESDIFLLVSRTEGLPRAIIEAMSFGLPCIGTNIGGIPELINKDLLVDVNNINQIVDKLYLLSQSFDYYSCMSSYSLEKAKEFSFSELEERRKLFFEEIKKL
ncbi:glycosyltransferase [Sphingobacterium spiritivorum]|uniref:Glycosyltransferase, group 1 family protein n=1 Tax=Sphingobacterium spiritivorum ATCC 33861 TaxID=525373 RepID=D7VI77_SPHSI|nr:glycosyltransferase [Sphingobacterium spiritivorum]EFK59779.1 glycosyltransferase, group 1 family protein [Sphingobacterium spiritivorum ATCC 33861]QQT37576.1 glycosyltransferase family 4 protein [Sphingobacterium spiritivorum]WQD34373.1 glycosyltransferase [Sphingobacterium spiritivorum]SUI97313.1 GDP-mannose-dependent alpha-(1-6)-phosphatidylinositol monomannoside mannosyltransferase [Sphingobacterium spiritivorum]